MPRNNGLGRPFDGFGSPNYTQVPDEVFDRLMPELSDAEFRALMYIIRRTFGFKRESDNISLSQLVGGITTTDGRRLDRGAGLSKSAAAKAVKSLAEKGIILSVRNRSVERGDEPTTYALRFRHDPVSTWWTHKKQGYKKQGLPFEIHMQKVSTERPRRLRPRQIAPHPIRPHRTRPRTCPPAIAGRGGPERTPPQPLSCPPARRTRPTRP